MPSAISPIPNPSSQLERAIIAYIQQCLAGAWASGTFTLQSDPLAAGSTAAGYNYYFSNDWRTRALPLYEVVAHASSEMPVHTRGEDCQVVITCEWKGNNIAGEANPDTNWVAINNQVGMLMAAMSQSDDGGDTFLLTCRAITAAGRALATTGSAQDQANHADMANFTCTALQYTGAIRAKVVDGTLLIMEKRTFVIRAVPANVD